MVGRFTRRATGRDDMEVECDVAYRSVDETAVFEVRLRASVCEWDETRLWLCLTQSPAVPVLDHDDDFRLPMMKLPPRENKKTERRVTDGVDDCLSS